MGIINQQRLTRGTAKTNRAIGTNKAFAWLDQIMAAAAGTASGEDALSVLNRKLEAAGVLGSGAADPVFATETALIYHQETSGNLFIRGSSDYTEISDDGTDTTVISVYLQSNGTPSITTAATWDGSTFNVPRTAATDWSRTRPSSPTQTLWVITYFLKGSNEIIHTPPIPIQNSRAEDITYTPSGTGNIASSVNNVKEALDDYDTATLGGGGSLTQQPSDWNATSGVTQILNKPPVPYVQEFPRTGSPLDTQDDNQDQAFTIPQYLRTYRDRYNQRLFVEANVNVELEASVDANHDEIDFRLKVVTPTGTDLIPQIISDTVSVENSSGSMNATARVIGILPNNFNSGLMRVTATRITRNQPVAGVRYFRIKVDPEIGANDIVVSNTDLGNNLVPEGLTTVEDLVDEIDELPIQPSDYEDVGWPDSSNAIDDDGNEVRRVVTFHRNLQNVNNRPGHAYVAKISYDAVIVTGSGGAITELNFVHKTYAGDRDPLPEIQSSNETTGRGAQTKTYNVTIPNDVTRFEVGITSNTLQSNGKLLITNYRVDFVEGIDAGGFTGNLNMDTNTVDALAKAVDELVIPPPGGNQNATQVPILNPTALSTFHDPERNPGGARRRTTIVGYESDPDDVQAVLRNFDDRLTNIHNPYWNSQGADWDDGSTAHGDFTLPTGTSTGNNYRQNTNLAFSDPIEIPAPLRGLGIDVDIYVQARTRTIQVNFDGGIRLTDPDTLTTFFGAEESVIQGSTGYENGDFVYFRRIIPAAMVPTTFRVRFRRNTGLTATATFDRVHVLVMPSIGGSGGVGGGGDAEPEVIWEAGPGVNNRATSIGTRNLISGKRFSDYRMFWVWADNGSNDREGAFYSIPIIAWTQITNPGHWIMTSDNFWRSVRYVSDTSWYKPWGINGIRKFYGW